MTDPQQIPDSQAALAEPGEPDAVLETAAEIAAETTPNEPVVADLASLANQRRHDWARRIRGERRLPGSLREHLAAVVEEASQVEDDAEPRLTVSQVANVFAMAVPSLLTLEESRAVAPHPAGEAFFHAGRLGDDDAARLASEQLARTGFSRAA